MKADRRARSDGGRPAPSEAPGPEALARARQARTVAVVLCVTIVGWFALQALGGALGWPTRWVFLADLAALGAFAWALIVTVSLWRRRKDG